MRINHNIQALNTYRQMGVNQNAASSSMEKLSSGLRINKAGDDAAGLSISEKMRGQIRGLDQASRNAQDGVSMIQTAEGALSETQNMLQRMRELSVQASNDTLTTEDRGAIQEEMNQLTSEISRIGNNTEFNNKKVINGDLQGSGVGATGGQVSFDLNSLTDGDVLEFKIGEETWTVNFDKSDASDDGESIDIANKTISLDIASGGTDTNAAAQLELVLSDLANGSNNSGANIANTTVENLSNFTFTDSANRLTIKANDAGDFSGADDVRNVISSNITGTGTIDEVNATDGTAGNGGKAYLQIGANKDQQFTVEINDMRSNALNISGTTQDAAHSVTGAFFTDTALTDNSGSAEYALDLSTADRATSAIEVLDNAIQKVSTERSKLGANQNRLENTINNLNTSSENLTAAESRIRDVDMAKEMMNMTKENIKAQAAQAMLAQANQNPQQVLQLLR